MSEPPKPVIKVPLLIWRSLIDDLIKSGQGRRESGAFVLGNSHASSLKALTYICYDALDPASLTGAVNFHSNGYAKLWGFCRENKLNVLFDIHTHPGNNVTQSSIDRKYPMIPQVGHLALIAPNFGSTSRWSLKPVGMYQYAGDFSWKTLDEPERNSFIRLSLW